MPSTVRQSKYQETLSQQSAQLECNPRMGHSVVKSSPPLRHSLVSLWSPRGQVIVDLSSSCVDLSSIRRRNDDGTTTERRPNDDRTTMERRWNDDRTTTQQQSKKQRKIKNCDRKHDFFGSYIFFSYLCVLE